MRAGVIAPLRVHRGVEVRQVRRQDPRVRSRAEDRLGDLRASRGRGRSSRPPAATAPADVRPAEDDRASSAGHGAGLRPIGEATKVVRRVGRSVDADGVTAVAVPVADQREVARQAVAEWQTRESCGRRSRDGRVAVVEQEERRVGPAVQRPGCRARRRPNRPTSGTASAPATPNLMAGRACPRSSRSTNDASARR